MSKNYQISIEKDENNMYVWEVVWLPACYTQAKTIPELLSRLMEVAEGSVELLEDLKNKKDLVSSRFSLSLKVDYAKA